jgi:3',5'-cyclic AMP phosphodiesterase CpdA
VILHLSDLQFGDRHRFEGASEYDTLLERLLQDFEHLALLADAPRPPKFDMVVFTGDLAQRGMKGEFDQALRFLTSLRSSLDLSSDRNVSTPVRHPGSAFTEQPPRS